VALSIRDLTADELEQVQVAKQVANDELKEMRKTLRFQMRNRTFQEREKHLALLAAIQGKPIIASLDGSQMYLDYDLLSKFTKKLDRQRLQYEMRLLGSNDFDRRLRIDYQDGWRNGTHGTLELLELSPRKRDLLKNLPLVDLGQ
jgi:hypothetical protein